MESVRLKDEIERITHIMESLVAEERWVEVVNIAKQQDSLIRALFQLKSEWSAQKEMKSWLQQLQKRNEKLYGVTEEALFKIKHLIGDTRKNRKAMTAYRNTLR